MTTPGERETEVYTVSMMREIVARKIAEDRNIQKSKHLRVFMTEMRKHHTQSETWKALTNILTELGVSITICQEGQ